MIVKPSKQAEWDALVARVNDPLGLEAIVETPPDQPRLQTAEQYLSVTYRPEELVSLAVAIAEMIENKYLTSPNAFKQSQDAHTTLTLMLNETFNELDIRQMLHPKVAQTIVLLQEYWTLGDELKNAYDRLAEMKQNYTRGTQSKPLFAILEGGRGKPGNEPPQR